MGGNGLIFQIVGVLLILFFFFLTFMCSKTWKIFHVIMLFLVFFAAISSAIYGALVLKTQKAWRTTYNRLDEQLGTAQIEGEQLLLGDISEVTDWRTRNLGALLTASGELHRYLMDSGRIWRHCTKTNVAGGAVTLSTVAPNTPREESRPNRIVEKMVLYGFLEQATPDGLMVPTFYLGEFQATNVTDSSVTIQPLRPLRADARQAVAQSNAPWSLYEMMPLDSHVAFAESATQDQVFEQLDANGDGFLAGDEVGAANQLLFARLLETTDISPRDQKLSKDEFSQGVLFGVMDEQKLRTLWMPNPGIEGFDELVKELVKDGTRATPEEIAQAPERIWMKVKFLKDHEVEVDSGDVQGVLEGTYFDRNGRAIVQRLRRGDVDSPEAAKFEREELAVFDQETADTMAADGVVELVGPVYVRKLNDYEYEFHQIASRMQKLDEIIRDVSRDTALIARADEQANDQIRYRQRERALLQEDKAHFAKEVQVVTTYVQKLDAKYTGMMGEMSRIYRSNVLMEQELERMNREMTEEIDRRTRAATASLP